ncbi:MAG: extracellular solute-binding protein [Firmicutes bacterium]|nr:extracellular solute-binding protein [Bacillota bacterium]
MASKKFSKAAIVGSMALLAGSLVNGVVSAHDVPAVNMNYVSKSLTGASHPLSWYFGNIKPYKKTVNITVGWFSSEPTGLPPGATQTNNAYVTTVEKTLNVHLIWSFLEPASELQTKENLVIADNQLPDVMVVNQQTMEELAQAGKIENLTSVFQKDASPYLKSLYASNDNRALKTATINGKLMAIPDTQIGYQWNLLWIRKDWLEKLHLQPPKTMAQVVQVAKDFIAHHLGGKNTIGLVGPGTNSPNSLTMYNNFGGLDTIFGAFGAYPTYWIDANGKAEYGSVQPQMVAALKFLRNMYKEGVLDPSFATQTTQNEEAALDSGQAGMFFGPWWISGVVEQTVENNPKVQWIAVPAPGLTANSKLNVIAPPWSENYIVVKKGFPDPGAVLKAIAIDQTDYRGHNPAGLFYPQYNPGWANWPLLVQLDYYDSVPLQYHDLSEALAKHNPGLLAPRDKIIYDRILAAKAESSDPAKDIAYWAESEEWTVGAKAVSENLSRYNQIEPLQVVLPVSMEAEWTELQSLENQTLLQIITGQKPVSAFQQFVQEWKALGGTKITQYVQAHMTQFLG